MFNQELVYFDENTHTYYVDGVSKVSTTKFIQNFEPPFPLHKIAERVSLRDGISKDDVINSWRNISLQATTNGTEIHAAIEAFITDGVINEKYEKLLNNITKLSCFKSLGNNVCEQVFYFPEYDLCGTFDYATFDSEGNFVLNDFKTGKPISNESKYGKYMRYPIESVPNTNYSKYSIQLGIYKRAIESFGFKCKGCYLIHIDKTQCVTEYPALELDDYIDILLDYWKNELKFDFNHEYIRFSRSNNMYL
jgi:hypothetical protein